MRGIGRVKIGKETVYTYFILDGRVAKLRLSPDECYRLDLFQGQQTPITFEGQELVSGLVTAVVSQTPFIWVELTFAQELRRAG